MRRREFLIGTAAAGMTIAAGGAIAHPPKGLPDYNLPEDMLNRPQFAGGSKVSMDGAYGKK
jgi:hypothetical protein